MKKVTVLVVFTLFVFLLVACQCVSTVSETANLRTGHLKKIPHLANRIYVTKQGVSADNMCDELMNILATRNHMTLIVDKERHYITTETKDVGHATLQRMTLAIQEKDNNSQLEITTEWKSGAKAKGFVYPVTGFSLQENWAPAQRQKNRSGIAFAESAAVANEIKNGIVSYDIKSAELVWNNRKKETRMELADY